MEPYGASIKLQEGRKRRQGLRMRRGMSLIEVMIVVAIMGVLATIAYPTYRESVAKGRRAQATAQLVAAQQWMERFYSENLSYGTTTSTTTGSTTTFTTSNSKFTDYFSTVPPPGEGTALYNLTVSTPTPGSFTITATRAGTMLADRCGDLTLDHLSRKSFVASSYSGFADVSAARAYCWR